MKQCTKCKQDKELDAFAAKGRVKQPYCRECQRAYRREHYRKNKQKYIDKALVWKTKAKIEFFTWLADQSCVDCGNSDVRVLQFDHVNGNKLYEIGTMVGCRNLASMQDEIAKCEVVCANCHAIRTASQFNWYNYMRT